MKIYISGKINGTDDYINRFGIVQEQLETEGFEVVNPALILSLMPKSTTAEEYMNICTCLLDICGAVYMMDGWRDSSGACIEYGYALGSDKIIMAQDKQVKTDMPDSQSETVQQDKPEESHAPLSTSDKHPRGKNKQIDRGKIMALHNAGWKNAKIADECGYGISTVYRTITSAETGAKL